MFYKNNTLHFRPSSLRAHDTNMNKYSIVSCLYTHSYLIGDHLSDNVPGMDIDGYESTDHSPAQCGHLSSYQLCQLVQVLYGDCFSILQSSFVQHVSEYGKGARL